VARSKAPLASPETPEQIEQQFYEALQRGDIERLMGVWADDDDVCCVHPGGPRLIGPVAIRAAFEAVFGNGAIDVQAHSVRRLQSHACAVHSVLERIRVTTAEGEQSAWVVATNVYVHGAQGWRMVAHHASPGSAHEAHERVETAAVLH